MVALACSDLAGRGRGQPRYLPSLLEAGPDLTGRRCCYSVDTVRRLRRQLPGAHLYFILGADQFLTLPSWKSYRALLKLCDFIVAARPGFPLTAARAARLAPSARVHLLTTVHADVSATAIRRRARRGTDLRGLVPPAVETYIRALGLYRHR